MLQLLAEGATTSAPSTDVWTVIGSMCGGIGLMVVAYFTRRWKSRTDEEDEANSPEPETAVRKAVRSTARSVVDEYRLLITDVLRKADEDEAVLRRQVRDLQGDLDRAREDAATWHRKHDVLQARMERHRD